MWKVHGKNDPIPEVGIVLARGKEPLGSGHPQSGVHPIEVTANLGVWAATPAPLHWRWQF
jgi:hypothetical protein